MSRLKGAAEPSATTPTKSYDALRLAIKLAVDEGDYTQATALIDATKRAAMRPASVTPIDSARDRKR